MQEINIVLTATLAALSISANAQHTDCAEEEYEGPYLNVSAAGYASKAEPLIVCTVVSPTVSIYHSTAFFVETSSGDAKLDVKYVDMPFPQRTADNWIEDTPPSLVNTLLTQLRTPAKATDAALIMRSSPIYYPPYMLTKKTPGRFGVCAYGYPKEGTAWTSVSISSLGDARGGYCYSQPTLYFEHD